MKQLADPFNLFTRQVELVDILRYRAAGLPFEDIAVGVRAIVKRATASDSPSTGYASRTATRRFHLTPQDVPETYREDPESLISFIIKTSKGRTFQITDASRGDDMSTGTLRFISVDAQPYGRISL